MEIYPIWKDVVHTVEVSGEYYDYEVRDDEENTLYRGRAYKLPNETTADIPIAKIVRPHISGEITLTDNKTFDLHQVTAWSKRVKIYNMVSEEVVAEYLFYGDWSYNKGNNLVEEAPAKVSASLSNVADKRQFILCSVADIGANPRQMIRIALPGYTTTIASMMSDLCTLAIDARSPSIKGMLEIYCGNTKVAEYTIADTCASHALYYMNDMGGWDYLLVTGNVTREDGYERVSMTRKVSNLTYEHGDVVVGESITRSWRLYTDYLTDAQWALMYQLYGSTKVYLHDLESGEITPVTITDNRATFKTFANQGKKKSYAEINVKAAQPRYRR